LARFEIPSNQRVGSLSGGQRAQVALSLALGKRPDLLLLDEPVSNLDPLARRQFLQVLLEHTASHGMTVVLSSHLLADLERACDYLVLLSASRVQLCGQVEDLLAAHRLVTGPPARVDALGASHALVESSGTQRQASALIRGGGPIHDPAVTARSVVLEELVLAYMNNPAAGTAPALNLVSTSAKGDSR
jgi:ABC-2 type transport system ATP-binding protein